MKGLNKITCCLLAALLMPCAGHAENEQYGANFNNADIRQFVEIVGQHLGKTILIDPSVQGTISVRSNDTFSQQEYYQFFLSILDLYGYSVITLDNGFLKVVRSANVKTSPGMIADSSRPGVGDELVTRIVPLENVPARDLAPLLRQMMDAGSVGNVVHYEPSNVLILTGRASTINKLIEVIKRVDVIGTEKQQIIHLEYASAEDLAEILNQLISESHGKSQMPALLSAKIVADKRTNSLIISGPEKARQRITSLLKSLDVEESEEGNTRVYWGVLLTALASNNKNDILATPSIVTLDNKLASFNVGQDVPVLSGSQTTSGDNVFNTVERKTVGTKLKVTPQVNEGDAVLLEIEQEVSSVDSSSNSTLGPTFNTRTIQNAVLVKTGETVVLGGLLDDFSKEQVSKVPLLGDIPLVGQLFRYTSTERAKRNLMVFIRPTIIRDDDVYRSLSKEKYTRYRQEQQQRIDGKSKALVGSEDLPVLDENTFNSHTPAPSAR